MPELPSTTALGQLVAAALLSMLAGFGGRGRWDRWRNGTTGRDARHIIKSIDDNGLETREVLRGLTAAISDLRLSLAEKRCPYASVVPPKG